MTGIANAVNGPEAAPYLAKAGGTMTGTLTLNTSSPSAALEAASKGYVDSVAVGLTIQPAVRVATISNLTATYANGSSGVGATLTNSGAMAAIAIDGVSLSSGNRVLVKDQTTTFQNGIYTVTTVGSGAANWVLTRATDFDAPADIVPGDFVVVNEGSTNSGTGWIQTATVTTIGTDPILWSLFSAASSADQSNLIIGGNFDTNPWQRGVTFAALADGEYSADRFNWQNGSDAVATILKTADAPTVAEAGIFSSNCFHVDITTADAAIAAGQYAFVCYFMEGYDWAQLAQRTFTLSFWVKSTKTGIFCVSFCNSGTDRSYVAEYTVNTTDTWEKKSITVSASPSAGTWNYTNGRGVRIGFALAAGSTFQTTADAWNVGNFVSTSNQVNALDSTSNNFKLQLIKIEPGSAATPWDIRTVEEELALCQRYYWKTFPQGVAPAQATGSAAGAISYKAAVAAAVSQGMNVRYPVVMRSAPTLTYYNPVNANTNWYNFATGLDSSAGQAGSSGDAGHLAFNDQVAGDTAGSQIAIHATASAEL